MYTERARFETLLDTLTDLTIDVVDTYAGIGGVHGFMTWDDWGLQTCSGPFRLRAAARARQYATRTRRR